MENALLLITAAVLIIVAVSVFAGRLGVAAPILLVLVGLACSLIPGAPEIRIEPEWILAVVLPPLLYAAAVNMPATDFRRDFGSIGALSVLLVLVSAFGSGLVISWVFPDLGLAAGVAVGAVISPPDAVAATSIGRRLGLPPRLVTILEGEGLVNDATALVTLRSAIAATAGTISFWGTVGDFAYAVLVGCAVGVVIGFATVWLRAKLTQPVLTSTISFIVPFLAYVPGEELHASGVLAVVAAGLVTGAQSARRFTAQDRLMERLNWRTVLLVLENGVFLLMGYQLTVLVNEVDRAGFSPWNAVGIGALATVALAVIRVLFVAPLIMFLRRNQAKSVDLIDRIDAVLERVGQREGAEQSRKVRRRTDFLRRKQADASFYVNEGLGWRGGAVLAWSGMRGVVTLAAAQSLPDELPHRAQLILIAFTVAILSLVVQGGTLPLLIRVLGIRAADGDEAHREFDELVTELEDAGEALLTGPDLRGVDGVRFDPNVVAQVRKGNAGLASGLREHPDPDAEATPHQQYRELRRLLVEAYQAALLDARSTGMYRSHTIEAAQRVLDSQATRFGDSPG
jgi:NhaP-type Na+/H+ or K+/H+ antiporter